MTPYEEFRFRFRFQEKEVLWEIPFQENEDEMDMEGQLVGMLQLCEASPSYFDKQTG